jgi:transposase
MTAARTKGKRKPYLLQKPHGVLIPRVRNVGPEHFGILAIDCAKARSRTMLANFFGQVLVPPSSLLHTQGDFRAAIDRLRQAIKDYDLRDVIVAIESTGEYHRPVQRAFRQAGFETRLVHPYTSKQYRQPADPSNKTDDTDLAAIFRATTQGFGLIEPTWPDLYLTLQLLRRHRRDLVDKNAILYCQIREVLHAVLPGYADCFGKLWECPAALVLARHLASPQAILQAGAAGLEQILVAAAIRFRKETLHKVLAWAQQAPLGHPLSLVQQRIFCGLDDDRLAKAKQITDLERDLAHLAVQTPYALLLAIPGINIVTVADLAGELGPSALYVNANAITGRAGLVPSRYQSDEVDHADGPLRRRGHRRLRAVLMQTADNLIQCNHYYQARTALWTRQRKDPRWIRVKVVKMFTRLAFSLVGGGQLFPHPCLQNRHYILGKIMEFHVEHRTPPSQLRQDLEAVVVHLSDKVRGEEAQVLQKQLEALANRRGPQPLANIIPIVLARLGAIPVESVTRERDPS